MEEGAFGADIDAVQVVFALTPFAYVMVDVQRVRPFLHCSSGVCFHVPCVARAGVSWPCDLP